MKMHRKNRRFTRIVLCVALMLGMLVSEPWTATETVQAASCVYEYSDMLGQGGYIYFIRTAESDASAVICRKKVSGGKVTQVAAEPDGVYSLVVSGKYLYYTTAEDGVRMVRMCGLDGSDVRTLGEGTVCHATADGIYVLTDTGAGRTALRCIPFDSSEEQTLCTAKKKQTLGYVCNIGTDSYYYLYDQSKERVYLYRLQTATDRMTRIAAEKRVTDSNNEIMVSDVKQAGGELFYDFGSYEGSGNFWCGTIKKLTTDGKKKTVAKYTEDDTIVLGSRELYFSTTTGDNYKYNLSSGKKTKYSLAFEKNISYTVLGDKTYMADTSNKKKITISRFRSGTERETLTKNFITIAFKQKKNVSYAVNMKQVGIYNLVCVTGTDFTDQSYGWRGRLVSVNWYITDGAGTVLGSFK